MSISGALATLLAQKLRITLLYEQLQIALCQQKEAMGPQ
jgi:hypothetical protein